VHSDQWGVLLLDPAAPARGEDDGFGAKAAFGDRLCRIIEQGRAHFVTDSDEISIMSLKADTVSGFSKAPTGSSYGWRRDLRWLPDLARYLNENTDQLSRMTYGVAVRYHYEDINPIWPLVEARSTAVVQYALSKREFLANASIPELFTPSSRVDLFVDKIDAMAERLALAVYQGQARLAAAQIRYAAAQSLAKRLFGDAELRKRAIMRGAKNPRWAIERLLAALKG
jgi:hypothetical protein